MFGCSIEIFRISESLKFDLVVICKSDSYIFEINEKLEKQDREIVTEEIKQGMKKRRTGKDTGDGAGTGGWEGMCEKL